MPTNYQADSLLALMQPLLASHSRALSLYSIMFFQALT